MERLNYNQLYYFYVVATEGSVKAACKRLHLTQPTISGQLKSLEDSLGFKLFERKYRKLEVNEQGRRVLKKAEKIFLLGDELIASLGQSDLESRQEIRIGVVPSLPNLFVEEFIVSGWKDHTHTVHIIHGALDDLVIGLDENKYDLILADTPYLKSSRKYRSINLGSQRLWVVGTKKFADVSENFPYSLHQQPFLGFSRGGQLQEDLDYFFKINNIRPDLIGSIDDAALIRGITELGLCVSVLPFKVVEEAVKDKKLIKIGELNQVVSNRWVITSAVASRKVAVRKLINAFMIRRKAEGPKEADAPPAP